MGLLLGLILPLLIIFLPIIILAVIGKGKKQVNRMEFSVVILVCSLLALVVPILATYFSVKGLMYNFGPDEPKCVTGAGIFLFFGYLLNIIGLPIIGIAFFPSKQTYRI